MSGAGVTLALRPCHVTVPGRTDSANREAAGTTYSDYLKQPDKQKVASHFSTPQPGPGAGHGSPGYST
jgi:hypothetical protein